MDGLAWQLPLDRLWEHYVEGIIRREAAQTGGEVKVGRLGQTTVPLHWSDPVHRTLGHLLPDIIVLHHKPVPDWVSPIRFGDSGLREGGDTFSSRSSTADWEPLRPGSSLRGATSLSASGRAVHIVDAKYKAHLAELDEVGWRSFIDEQREAHRADLHQVLAYASLFDAQAIRATLVYPLRSTTWQHLRARGRDISSADVYAGGRHVRLELRGVPFGGANG